MKNFILEITVILSISCLLITGCSQFGYVVGVGPIATKTFDYNNFTEVEISSSFEFDISQANNYNIMVSAHQNMMDYLDIFQSGTTLIVRLKSGHFSSPNPKITITMPGLYRLSVSGASKGSARNFQSTTPLILTTSGASRLNINLEGGETKLDISGASKVTGNLKSTDTHLTISGASHCEINGSAGFTNVEVSGASHLTSPDFLMQNADVNLSGASTATVNIRGTLNLDVTGASTLNYLGDPILSKVTVNGASKINAQ